MSRKRLTLLVSAICAVALLVITVMPAVASPPKVPKVQFADVLEQLTEEGVISSEQAEIIVERTGAIFGRMETMGRAYRQRTKEMAVARSRPIIMRISQSLDMKPSELSSQLKEGRTVAQIAEEQGISTSAVVDELLAPIKEALDRAVANGKLSQEQAEQKLSEAESRIGEMVQEVSLEDIVKHEVNKIRKQGERARRSRVLLHQVCQIVNLDHEELLAQLKDGKKIVEIAQGQGVSRDELLEALTDRAQDRLNKAVSEGKLDEEKAAEIMPKIEEKLARFVDKFPPGK